jgi:hypothetical protein
MEGGGKRGGFLPQQKESVFLFYFLFFWGKGRVVRGKYSVFVELNRLIRFKIVNISPISAIKWVKIRI